MFSIKYSRLFHCWWRIHFNEPAFKIFINQDIESIDIKGILSGFYGWSCTPNCIDDNLLNLLLDSLVDIGIVGNELKVLNQLLLEPHIPMSMIIFYKLIRFLCDAIIGEVCVFVLKIIRGVILSTEPNIALLIIPYLQGI